jgi:hypothetical protein
MNATVHAAVAPVLEEIGVQLDLLDTEGGAYARAYLAHSMGNGPRPRPPYGMHAKIAAALRDMALDQAVAVRLYGRRAGAAS